MLNMTEIDETKEVQGALLNFGEVNVNKQPKLYKKSKSAHMKTLAMVRLLYRLLFMIQQVFAFIHHHSG